MVRRFTLLIGLCLAVGCAAPSREPGDGPATSSETADLSDTHVDPDAIRSFTIDVPDAVLKDLRARLERTRLPDQIDGVGWDYGTPLEYLTDLVAYWRDEFDWRKEEARLNQFDQYKTVINGLDTHFIHQRSAEPEALPIIITHGWPGSIAEFAEVIWPLTDPVAHGGEASDAFHVVAPSMPGYGFSEKPNKPGYGPEKIAEIGAELMARLGYEEYGVQGGDWGATVSRWHAHNYPDRVVGLHLNMVNVGPPAGTDDPTAGIPPEELERSRDRRAFYDGEENGYARIQATRPQTLGYALNDSPAGQAAWIVEKFRAWCDCRGDPESVFTRDELLTNIMIYWVTETATSSARLYYENSHITRRGMQRIEVPTGAIIFPHELFIAPRKWVEARYNLTHWTERDTGGHFAAMEQPEVFVEDLRAFFETVR